MAELSVVAQAAIDVDVCCLRIEDRLTLHECVFKHTANIAVLKVFAALLRHAWLSHVGTVCPLAIVAVLWILRHWEVFIVLRMLRIRDVAVFWVAPLVAVVRTHYLIARIEARVDGETP